MAMQVASELDEVGGSHTVLCDVRR
jgi:hypothetical protein